MLFFKARPSRVALTVLMLCVCLPAHAGEKVMYQVVSDSKPDIGVSTTMYLGDRLLVQRIGEYQDCVVPKFSYEKTVPVSQTFTVEAGRPLCRKSLDDKLYWPTYVNFRGSSLGPTRDPVELIEKKGGTLEMCRVFSGFRTPCTKGKKAEDYDREPFFFSQDNSFQQTIEYAGKSGQVLKFIYAEYTDNLARQAFTREFQADLNEGNVVAYKGAIIEVEEASNASITYKVIRNFQ